MELIANMFKSFITAILAYLLLGIWINCGSLEPTMKTPGIAWWLDGAMFLFWIVGFIALSFNGGDNGSTTE
ncbi:hypothetical protein ESZ50_04830 [Weissella muntiaci]|uniref:Uncharacterized protein n=1 Tax=Weissella muntiaci TaxID=2508881 RepID=A0A6C2C7G8_9LACO|nr:hypothetical protein [Weissella muntiaci]TYC49918.1 hypothetical protein ESZ50_04830 [Weissella muntiaci]